MLDLHAHVLPGIDDGPRTLEDAVALARALADDGVEHVVATPHIYPGVFDNTPDRIADAFERLRGAIADSDIGLTMTWAAEVRICPEIIDWLERRRLPLLNGSLVGPSTVLIELPDGQIPVGTDRLLARLVDHGITPLMAHPERNKAVMEQPNRLEALRRLGCRFQLTAGSIVGDFGSRARNTATQLLEAGWVDVVGSDAHNLSGRRPRMSAARAWIREHFGAERAEQLFVTQPAQIAGVTSFAVQSGDQRLVFRDLPAAPSGTIGSDTAWAAGLSDLQTDLAPQNPPATSDWLTDFRIDSITQRLQQGVSDALADSLPGADEGRLSASPVHAEAPEDWTLPTPLLMPQARPERSSVRPVRPAAPPSPEARPVSRAEDIQARVTMHTTPVEMQPPPQHEPPASRVNLTPAPVRSPAPVRTTAQTIDVAVTTIAPSRELRDETRDSPPPQRQIDHGTVAAPRAQPALLRPEALGMRLHDVADPTRHRPAERPVTSPARTAEPNSPYRPTPRFNAASLGSARPGLAQAQGLTPGSRRPAAHPSPAVPPPVESPLSVRVLHQMPQPDATPLAPPSETPRGFRLSDLPPLPVRRGRPV